MEPEQISSTSKNAAKFTKIGFGITIVYLLVLAAYSISEWKELGYMTPNELGDFLAGVFGPLAFFWLVCGYLQQGVELKNNSTALMLQAEELRISSQALVAQVAEMKESVAQQKLVAEVTRGQFEAAEATRHADEEKYKPIFHVIEIAVASATRKIILVRNSGHGVMLIPDNAGSLHIHADDSQRFESGMTIRLVLMLDQDLERMPAELMFRQDNGKAGVLSLYMPQPESPGWVKPTIEISPVL